MFIQLLTCLLMLCAHTMHAAASSHAVTTSPEIIGVHTSQTRTIEVHPTGSPKNSLFTVVSAPADTASGTLHSITTACASINSSTKKDSACGQQMLKLIQQFKGASAGEFAVAFLRLKGKEAYIRSCSFGQSKTGSHRLCAFPYSTVITLRDDTEYLQFNDAHCIMVQDRMPKKTPGEIAQATYEDGKHMRIVVNFAAWRQQAKKRT